MGYVGNKPPQTTIPVDDSVTTAMVQDDAVTADKVANAINTSIAANTSKVTNATHTGDVTGATALTIATGAVEAAMIADDAVTAAKIASGVLENPNVVINGGFDVWQRGTSFTSLSYYQDYADRWMGDAHNSGSNTISRQAGTASEPFYYFLRFQRDSGQTVTGARRVGTVFESQDTRFMCGKEVTLSWYMRKGANWSPATDTVTSYIFTGTGNDESMSSGLGSGWTGNAAQSQSNTITTSWVRFTHTVTLSATAMQVGINFVTPASVGTAGAADSWDISGIKLELGGVATPFMNKTYGQELDACRRYYFLGGAGNYGMFNAATTIEISVPYPVKMRTTPSFSLAKTSFTISDKTNGSTAAQTSVTVVNHSGDATGSFYSQIGNAGTSLSASAGDVAQFRVGEFLAFDAEL